ncbi:MAG: D-alanine--D-alanine ligase [Chloroflexi bacterium]|nr:D-alanine--D-alanine ligase [Chloroflexota bacterium]
MSDAVATRAIPSRRSGPDRRSSVAVVMGGPSAEHDVSLVSGRAIAEALGERGHDVELWLIDLGGLWWRLPASAGDRAIPKPAFDRPAELGGQGPLTSAGALERLTADDPAPTVFLALHGPFGEDGTVQALCESAGLVYTGSGVAASAMGMDKVLFKRLVGGMDMPVVPWQEVTAESMAAGPDAALSALLAFASGRPDRRLIIKPARMGSSVGISIVHRPNDPAELEAALREAFRYDDLALAEAYLGGARELEVSVLGNGDPGLEIFGPGEVFPGREFYDYRAKYQVGLSRTTERPELDPAIRARARELARACHLAIGATGFSRVDFLLHGGRIYLSEINTIPGFTPISLFPVLCAEGGYSFAETCERILELAHERATRRPSGRLTPDQLPRD